MYAQQCTTYVLQGILKKKINKMQSIIPHNFSSVRIRQVQNYKIRQKVINAILKEV